MEETTLDNSNFEQPKKRPVFITVLCILTWIGSGIGFLQSALALISGPTSELEELKNTPGVDEMLDLEFFDNFIFWSNVSNGSAILVSALCVVGAVLMFQLKKIGFFLYLGGCIVSIIVTVLAMHHLIPDVIAWIGHVTIAFMILINAAFIIMYAVNLKHMK